MNEKVGFWRWLLLKIRNGLKIVFKSLKLLKDIAPEDEMLLSILGLEVPIIFFSFAFSISVGLFIGLPIGVIIMLLIFAHAIYRREMEWKRKIERKRKKKIEKRRGKVAVSG